MEWVVGVGYYCGCELGTMFCLGGGECCGVGIGRQGGIGGAQGWGMDEEGSTDCVVLVPEGA